MNVSSANSPKFIPRRVFWFSWVGESFFSFSNFVRERTFNGDFLKIFRIPFFIAVVSMSGSLISFCYSFLTFLNDNNGKEYKVLLLRKYIFRKSQPFSNSLNFANFPQEIFFEVFKDPGFFLVVIFSVIISSYKYEPFFVW